MSSAIRRVCGGGAVCCVRHARHDPEVVGAEQSAAATPLRFTYRFNVLLFVCTLAENRDSACAFWADNAG